MKIFENSKRGTILIFVLVLGMMVLLASIQKSAAKDHMGRDLFEQGNEAYMKGDYEQALVHYKTAMNRDGYTPSLLYNLANAYYMKKELGQAILNYERARYLDPGNADIKANLALARKNAGLITPDEASWKAFLNRLTLNGWTWAAVIALCTLSLMALVNGIRPGSLKGPAPKMMVCLCLVLFMTAGTGMVVQYRTLNRGVITVDNAELRISPFDSAATSGVVKNGKMVNLTGNYKGYVFIKGTNGQSGWIPEGAVSQVLPNGDNRHQTSLTHSTVGGFKDNDGAPHKNKT